MQRKILYVMHLPPPVHGASMVGQYIHDSKLINKQFECRYINLMTASSLEDIGKIGYSKLKSFGTLLKSIRKEIAEFRPNYVYVTPNAKGGAFYKDYIVVLLLKTLGCKIIVHYHNKGVSTRQDKWLDNILYQRFFKGIKVILLGKSLYKDVEKYVKWDDVYICPNGIPVAKEDFRFNEREKSNEVPRLLFLSNLIESKGVIVLLDALKILKNKGFSFVCDFVGGETAEINTMRFGEEVSKRGLNEMTIYRGRKYGEDKIREYQQADIFVFPTYYDNECFPLVLLEAMEQGLPCISTSEGAICDIINDGVNGLIAERKNAESLANKIETLLNDKDLRIRMGNAGKEKFQKEFTLEKFEERICDILQTVTAATATLS